MRGQDELREVGGLDSSVWDRQLVGENLKSQQTVAPGTLRLSRHSCRKQGDGRVGRPLTENAELGQLEVPPGLGCVAAADTERGRYHWGFQLPGAWVCLNPQHREEVIQGGGRTGRSGRLQARCWDCHGPHGWQMNAGEWPRDDRMPKGSGGQIYRGR